MFTSYVWHDVNKDTIFFASSLYNSRREERNIRGIILSSNTKFTILLISRSFENFFENCSNNSLRSRNEFSALDLSKGFFVSANLIQSSRRKKRFSGHKPRSRLSSSRLNYDHGHYSGQTRLSVSTRPSPLAAIPDYSRETASIRGVSVISEIRPIEIRFIRGGGAKIRRGNLRGNFRRSSVFTPRLDERLFAETCGKRGERNVIRGIKISSPLHWWPPVPAVIFMSATFCRERGILRGGKKLVQLPAGKLTIHLAYRSYIAITVRVYIYIQGGWKNRKLQDLRDDCLKTNMKEIVHVICRKLLCYVNWKNKFLTELVETYKLFSIFYIYKYISLSESVARNAIFLLLFSPQQVWKDNKINGRESRMIDGSWKVINSCSKVAETSVNINGFGKAHVRPGAVFVIIESRL